MKKRRISTLRRAISCKHPGKAHCKKARQPEGSIPLVAGSASLKGKELFLTITNSHAHEAAEVTVALLGGARVKQAKGQVLNGEIHAHNTFAAPRQVTPQALDLACQPEQLNLVESSLASRWSAWLASSTGPIAQPGRTTQVQYLQSWGQLCSRAQKQKCEVHTCPCQRHKSLSIRIEQ